MEKDHNLLVRMREKEEGNEEERRENERREEKRRERME